VRNTGDAPMPFGFGAHPYFHAPLDPKGSRGMMSLKLAADSHWPLSEKLIPTAAPDPVKDKFDLRSPRVLGNETYDDAFRMAPYKKDEPRARLIDPSVHAAIEVRADPIFEDFVIFVPPGQDVVAIEPYTCAPDAFNLAARGVESGMLELWPGESWSGGFEIRISAP